MPDGDLLDVHGAPTSLARLRGGRPAVVVFYRGAWCPYCNIALRTYQAELVPALGRTRRRIDCRQPTETRRFADFRTVQ